MSQFLTIPDDLTQLVPWLEAELLGQHLHLLSAEMFVVLQRPEKIASEADVEKFLGNDALLVQSQGLSALPDRKVRQLLTQPELLLPMQEWLMIYGESYWQEKIHESFSAHKLEAGKSRFLELLQKPTSPPLGLVAKPESSRRNWNWSILLTAAAAVLLVAGYFLSPPAEPQVTWGWNEPNLFAEKPTPKVYLEQLATSSEVWFKKRPETQEAVAKRIREMQMGCDRLIVHDHPPLNAEQKTWLIEKCKAWREKFVAQLAALDSGTPPLEVRNAMDGIVTQLATKLREEAGKV